MLHSTTEPSRLYLTAELRAVDGLSVQPLQKSPAGLFNAEMKRFPPVDDVLAILDRIASRAFAA